MTEPLSGISEDEAIIGTLANSLIERGCQVSVSTDMEGSPYIIFSLPKGAKSRRIEAYSEGASVLNNADLENLCYLSGYEALANFKSGEIEVELVAARGSLGIGLGLRRLHRLPGVEILDSNENEDEDPEDQTSISKIPRNWRLLVSNGSQEIELSPPSDLFSTIALERLPATLKVRNVPVFDEASAEEVLESLVASMLFDLDLRYDMSLELRRPHTRKLRVPNLPTSRTPPNFPINRYSPEPLSLYQYGRSASGTPLLQFLAYYQVLEYFFPIFTRDESIRKLRAKLRDPRFDLNEDASLSQVISILQPQGRATLSEKEQLRAAVRSCVTPSFISDFISFSAEATAHFTGKPVINGVHKISINPQASDLCNQIADRIYAIRCRVVHTKQDSGDTGIELLLPSSIEVQSLGPDIALLRAIAQHAIVAAASPLKGI